MYFSEFRDYFQTSTPIEWSSLHLDELCVEALRRGPIPQHIAFVMDGNRRFAKIHDIPIAKGHILGVDATIKVRRIYL